MSATADDVTVIVVSHGRPDLLARCVQALAISTDAALVVVADAEGIEKLQGSRHPAMRTTPFSDRNIAAARNLGLAMADTPLVAFIDDDAVPDPGWLAALTSPLAEPSVAAATGFVRSPTPGRWQFRGEIISPEARITGLSLPPDRVTVLPPPAEGAVVTIGTNCAFRRADVDAVGGFDPAYRYFLDESDLNMRLARVGAMTAIVPWAVVRHDRAAGPYRDSNGTIRDPARIGESLRHFIGRYAAPDRVGPAFRYAIDHQMRGPLRDMIAGHLEPRAIRQMRDRISAAPAD